MTANGPHSIRDNRAFGAVLFFTAPAGHAPSAHLPVERIAPVCYACPAMNPERWQMHLTGTDTPIAGGVVFARAVRQASDFVEGGAAPGP